MRRFTFLPSEVFYSALFILGYILWTGTIYYKILLSVFLFVVLFIFRRTSVPFRDTLKNDGEIFLSPVYGIVESIRRDTTTWDELSSSHEIRISLGITDQKGLYLPTSSEVSFLRASKGDRVPRYSESQNFYRPPEELAHTDFVLTSKNRTKTLMRFIDCKYGIRPSIWLKSGDRGRAAACFGHYPFGGTLIIYLPQNCDILVFEKERLVPGQSVIAAIKD